MLHFEANGIIAFELLFVKVDFVLESSAFPLFAYNSNFVLYSLSAEFYYIARIEMDQPFVSIVLMCFCVVIPLNLATFQNPEPISRDSGSVLYNILGERTYKHHIVTSRLDVSSFWLPVYRFLKDAIRL